MSRWEFDPDEAKDNSQVLGIQDQSLLCAPVPLHRTSLETVIVSPGSTGGTEPLLHQNTRLSHGSMGSIDLPIESYTKSQNRKLLFGATMNLVGSTLGTGVVALPFAFASASVLVASVAMLVVVVMTMMSLHLLAVVALNDKRKTYGDIAKCFGHKAVVFVDVLTIFVLFGVVLSVQMVFYQSCNTLLGDRQGVFNGATLTVLMALLIVFPLSLLRKFAHLKFSSFFALAALIGLVALVVAKGIAVLIGDPNPLPNSEVYHLDGVGLLAAIPIIVYSFGCQVQAVPVLWELPTHLRTTHHFFWVCIGALIICAVTFGSMGAFGVLAFPHVTSKEFDGDILQMLPHNGVGTIARIALSLSLSLMSPLLVWPMRYAVDKLLFQSPKALADAQKGTKALTRHVIVTAIILSGTSTLSIVLPSVKDVFSFVGATGGCLMFYIYPSMCYLGSQGWKSNLWHTFLSVFIFLVGGVACVLCTYTVCHHMWLEHLGLLSS